MSSGSLNSQSNSGDLSAKDLFLKNPDLVAMTISHLRLTSHKKRRQCLFNVALSCKDFLDEALDALWEELNSLVLVLKVLPASQFEDGEFVRANVHHKSMI